MRSIYLLTLACALSLAVVRSEASMSMNFKEAHIIDVIEAYAKKANQKFIVDPGVRGKISIFLQRPVSTKEAYDKLSSALALNGYAISQQDGTYVVMSARNIQRNHLEVTSERPELKPERMVVWIYQPKHVSAESIGKELRNLPSKDGEVAVSSATNQIVFTDWTSNLNRVAEILARVDRAAGEESAKSTQ